MHFYPIALLHQNHIYFRIGREEHRKIFQKEQDRLDNAKTVRDVLEVYSEVAEKRRRGYAGYYLGFDEFKLWPKFLADCESRLTLK